MRIATAIEYDGTAYHGWQRQNNGDTVQACIEDALSHVANEPITVICAGRTDAGVHAREQIIHFDTVATRDERAWIFGANANLPRDISVRWVKSVDDNFHARFSATSRRYHYHIYNHPIRSALTRHSATWQCLPLDIERMQQAAQHLVGEHDFTSFRAQSCQAHTPIRTVEFIRLEKQGDVIIIDIQANAFLQHMVRNIAGVLMSIGAGRAEVDWTHELLESKSREKGGVTARPEGLYLVGVEYDAIFGLPKSPFSGTIQTVI
jgi:tRNA pseudouridine38-40 synthase